MFLSIVLVLLVLASKQSLVDASRLGARRAQEDMVEQSNNMVREGRGLFLAPKAPKAPKETNGPKAPKETKETNGPKAPKAPKETNGPKAPKAPKETNGPKSPKAPKAPKAETGKPTTGKPSGDSAV